MDIPTAHVATVHHGKTAEQTFNSSITEIAPVLTDLINASDKLINASEALDKVNAVLEIAPSKVTELPEVKEYILCRERLSALERDSLSKNEITKDVVKLIPDYLKASADLLQATAALLLALLAWIERRRKKQEQKEAVKDVKTASDVWSDLFKGDK